MDLALQPSAPGNHPPQPPLSLIYQHHRIQTASAAPIPPSLNGSDPGPSNQSHQLSAHGGPLPPPGYSAAGIPLPMIATTGGVPGPLVAIPAGAGGPVTVGGNVPLGVGGSHGLDRMNEYLEGLKGEFEALQGDCIVLKGQRDEYEGKINQQIQEIALIRQSLYELESQHAKIRNEYEAEINRFRRDLDVARSTNAAPSSVPINNPIPTVAPSPSTNNPGPVPNFMPNPPSAPLPGLGGSPAERERERLNRERNRDRDKEREREDKYKMDIDEKRDVKNPLAPSAGTYPTTPTGAIAPQISLDRERERERERERDREERERERDRDRDRDRDRERERDTLPPVALNPIASARATPTSQPSTPPMILSEIDPETVPRELKKEGPGWSAIWNPKVKKHLDLTALHTLRHVSVVCCVKFSNDGRWLATGSNRAAMIYDTKTGEKHCTLIDESATDEGDLYIRSIDFSNDGQYLATGAEDNLVRIWDIKKKRIKHLLQGHTSEIYSLAYSKDGQYLVSGSGDRSIRMFDTHTGSCLWNVTVNDPAADTQGGNDTGITCVTLSSDGRLCAASSLDRIIRVYEVASGEQVERIRSHSDSVYSVAFSPCGNYLASGSLDKTVKVFDLGGTHERVKKHLAGGKLEQGSAVCMFTLLGHKDYVLSTGWTPDGQYILSGSKDRSIMVWNFKTQLPHCMISGHKNSVINLDVTKNGLMFASGSGDTTAKVWGVDRL